MNKNYGTADRTVPLVLSFAGSFGVMPFAVARFLDAQYAIALLDLIIVAGLLTIAWRLYNDDRVRPASIALAIVIVCGVTATIYLQGANQALWLYAVVVGIFFLLRRAEAVVVNAATIAIAIPVLMGAMTRFELMSLLASLGVTGALSYAFATVTRRQHEALMQLARRDPLTGAGNRLALEEKIEGLIGGQRLNDSWSSLIMFDLDHFKEVNDHHGHQTGDTILRKITEIIRLRIRTSDTIYRIGGEEFVIVLEGQRIADASRLAEQLRRLVETHELAPDRAVTISLGVAQFEPGESAKDWLRRADVALYRAKHAGRNNTQLSAA